jgi:hypothetical protein
MRIMRIGNVELCLGFDSAQPTRFWVEDSGLRILG